MIGREVRSARRAQRGQGLLLLLLVMLVAGAAVLLDGIGSRASIRAGDDEGTTRALALAKEALIAYAVLDANRPGELPCPDFNRNGVINPIGNEDYAHPDCRTRRGWLPWRTLDMEDVRDGAGEPLWYAVAQDYFARSGVGLRPPINPDTAGGLTVDSAGATDIVAVIIAPGEARGGQSRPADPPGGAPDATAHVAQYLEGANADPDLDTYAASGGADFNDRMVYITSDELLRAVEQRVLGEVAAALWAYRQANGAYPWLSPFEDPTLDPPSDTVFDGVPGTRIGHLAYNDAADVGTHAQDTGFTITWDAGDAPITVVADSFSAEDHVLDPASALLMQNSAAADAAAGSHTFATPSNPTGGDPSCTWQGSNAVADCVATALLQPPYQALLLLDGNPLTVQTVQVTREISIDVAYTGAAAVGSLDGARVRDVASGDTFQSFPDAAAVSTITVRHYLPSLPQIAITRRLTISQGSTASVNLGDIYLEPSVAGALPGDLPAWFYANEWHRFVLVEYAGNALPGESLATGTACTTGACVSLDVRDDTGAIGVTLDDLHAVVIGAGSQIAPGQDRYSGSAALADFFEEKNALPADATAERRPWRSAWDFNDQVRAVLQPSF